MYIFFRSRGKCHRKFVSGNPLGRPRPKPTTNKQNSPADMVKGRGGEVDRVGRWGCRGNRLISRGHFGFFAPNMLKRMSFFYYFFVLLWRVDVYINKCNYHHMYCKSALFF